MSIMRNLKKVHAAVALDIVNGGTLASEICGRALDAMMQGKESQAWTDYMSLFADNAAQLNRLKADADLVGRPWLRQSRGYILGNALCDATTGTKLFDRVDTRLDEGIASEDPDGTIVKVINIPDPT